jgi:hypothetical protein
MPLARTIHEDGATEEPNQTVRIRFSKNRSVAGVARFLVIAARPPRARPARFLMGQRYSAADALGGTRGSAAGTSNAEGGDAPGGARHLTRHLTKRHLTKSCVKRTNRSVSGVGSMDVPASSAASLSPFTSASTPAKSSSWRSPTRSDGQATGRADAERAPRGGWWRSPARWCPRGGARGFWWGFLVDCGVCSMNVPARRPARSVVGVARFHGRTPMRTRRCGDMALGRAAIVGTVRRRAG